MKKIINSKVNEILNYLMDAGINAGKEACIMFMEEVIEQIKNSNNHMENENWVMTKEVYMDTCSLMHPGAEKFFLKYVPLFEKYGKKINTLSCCIREIEKHLSSDDYNTRNLAQKAKSNIDKLIKAGLLNVVDYSDDVFADGDFAAVFVKKRIKEEILFITQDGDLSIDIYNLNDMRSIKGHEIIVQALDYDGGVVTNPKLAEYLGADKDFDYDEEDDIEENNSHFVDIPEENCANVSQPRHEIWESIGREHEISPNSKYQYLVNGIPADEAVVNKLFGNVNAAIAAGEPIIVERVM